jgi:tetratricopeptide (TPR) repeat protein
MCTRIACCARLIAWLPLIAWLGTPCGAQERRIERVHKGPDAASAGGGRWALVVGVDRYQSPEIDPLSGAVADARAIGAALVRYADFPQAQVTLLVSDGADKPTAGAIMDRLDEIKRSAKPTDLLLFFFAGHGVQVDGQRYLLTYEANIGSTGRLKTSSLAASALMQELEAIRVTHRVIMVDACRNDPTKPGHQPNVADEAFENAFTLQPSSEGGVRATFLSSSKGQSAYEWTEKQRGFFSYFVEKGLSGEAAQYGKVTVTSLLTYLNEMVPRKVREQKNQLQVPYAKVDGSELVLVRGEQLPAQTPTLDSQPAAARTIYGVVKDSSGAPLAGATVLVAMAGPASRGVRGQTAQPRAELRLTTDEDGFFKADGVAPDTEVKVTATKDRYLPRTLVSTPAEAGRKLVVFLPRSDAQARREPQQPSLAPQAARSGSGELALVAYRTFLAEDFQQAEAEARAALQVEPESPLANAVMGNAMLALGVNTGDAGKTAAAREFVERALRGDPELALAHNARGLGDMAERRFDQALPELQTAIRSDPRLAPARANLGYVLAQQNHLEQAEREYREAIRLAPESAVPYNGLSAVLFSMGRYADAVKACREAIGRYQLQDRVLGLLYVQLAVTQFQRGRKDEAIEAVGRARALGVAHHEAYDVIEKAKSGKSKG